MMLRPSLHYPTWKANREGLFFLGAVAAVLALVWLLIKLDAAENPRRA